MAISFQLSLTPNQIEFLQGLDLYADGVIPVGDVPSHSGHKEMFISWVKKLIREGLVEHLPLAPGMLRSDDLRFYRITEKGRTVLGLIEQDVEAFLARQKAYRDAKVNGAKKKRA